MNLSRLESVSIVTTVPWFTGCFGSCRAYSPNISKEYRFDYSNFLDQNGEVEKMTSRSQDKVGNISIYFIHRLSKNALYEYSPYPSSTDDHECLCYLKCKINMISLPEVYNSEAWVTFSDYC